MKKFLAMICVIPSISFACEPAIGFCFMNDKGEFLPWHQNNPEQRNDSIKKSRWFYIDQEGTLFCSADQESASWAKAERVCGGAQIHVVDRDSEEGILLETEAEMNPVRCATNGNTSCPQASLLGYNKNYDSEQEAWESKKSGKKPEEFSAEFLYRDPSKRQAQTMNEKPQPVIKTKSPQPTSIKTVNPQSQKKTKTKNN